MNNKELENRINRLRSDIRELKTNQSIGGDSWVVYRTLFEFTKQPGSINIITFTPDVAGDFVARAIMANPAVSLAGNEFDITPDPNIKGKWWECSFAFSPVTRTIFIYSTRKGKVTIENYTAPMPV